MGFSISQLDMVWVYLSCYDRLDCRPFEFDAQGMIAVLWFLLPTARVCAAAPVGRSIFNAAAFGAVGDGRTDNSKVGYLRAAGLLSFSHVASFPQFREAKPLLGLSGKTHPAACCVPLASIKRENILSLYIESTARESLFSFSCHSLIVHSSLVEYAFPNHRKRNGRFKRSKNRNIICRHLRCTVSSRRSLCLGFDHTENFSGVPEGLDSRLHQRPTVAGGARPFAGHVLAPSRHLLRAMQG